MQRRPPHTGADLVAHLGRPQKEDVSARVTGERGLRTARPRGQGSKIGFGKYIRLEEMGTIGGATGADVLYVEEYVGFLKGS
jgi:hypothetical protein